MKPTEPITEDWVRSTLAEYDLLEENAWHTALEIARARGKNLKFLSGPKITWDGDRVTAEFYDDYGHNDSVYVDFPLSYLWDTDLMEAEKERLRREQEEIAARKAKLDAEHKAIVEENERAHYERLKKKYG